MSLLFSVYCEQFLEKVFVENDIDLVFIFGEVVENVFQVVVTEIDVYWLKLVYFDEVSVFVFWNVGMSEFFGVIFDIDIDGLFIFYGMVVFGDI